MYVVPSNLFLIIRCFSTIVASYGAIVLYSAYTVFELENRQIAVNYYIIALFRAGV